MTSEEPQEPITEKSDNVKKSQSGTTITGSQLLIAILFTPCVITWLVLAARIIWSASSNPETLDNIEGLLTALAVLTIPISQGLSKLWEAYGNETHSSNKGE